MSERKTPPDPAEFDQVLDLLRGRTPIGRFVIQSARWSHPLDAQFLHAAQYHKVQEQVMGLLIEGGAPANHRLRAELESAVGASRVTRQHVAASEEEVEEVFGKADLPWMALKGLSYEQRYLRGDNIRHVRDLDVLVSPSSLDVAVGILQKQGFTPADAAHKAFTKRRRRLDDAANMVRGKAKVDLHWQLRNPGAYQINYDRIWSKSVPAAGSKSTKRWLSESDDLQFILLSIAHDIQRGACRLKHLLDARAILSACHERLNWSEFLALRTEEHTVNVILNALDVTHRILSLQHCFSSVDEVLERRRNRLVCTTNQEAEQLLTGRRGNVNNQRWFGKCYPERSWRSIVRFVDRNILSPGRIPWALIKGCRRWAG